MSNIVKYWVKLETDEEAVVVELEAKSILDDFKTTIKQNYYPEFRNISNACITVQVHKRVIIII